MFKYFFKNSKNDIFKSYFSDTTNTKRVSFNEVGVSRHYPPAIRVWNNSIYNFENKNQNDSITKYNKLDKLIKSYFNLHNDIGLARSKRMRYKRIKSGAKRLYVSKPELKQTNDKVTITVYYFDKLKHNFIRKLFFFNRPNMVKFILNKRFKRKRRNKKKLLIQKTRFLQKRIKYLGIKQIKELRSIKDNNKLKKKYVDQSLWLYFIKYILSLINIQIYNPMYISNSLIYELSTKEETSSVNILNLIVKKERLRILNIVNKKPKLLFWINFNNNTLEKIDELNINYNYLISKAIKDYNFTIENVLLMKNSKNLYINNEKFKLNFLFYINNKLWMVIKRLMILNVLSTSLILKLYNYYSLTIYENYSKKIFSKKYNKISKLVYLSMSNVLKFKTLLPTLKMLIDTFYNKKTELNMVNLKYFYLNNDIFTQAIITKMKGKVNPGRILRKSIRKIKLFLNPTIRRQSVYNKIEDLSNYSVLSLNSLINRGQINDIQTDSEINNSKLLKNKDWLQSIFNKLYPYNLLHKYNKLIWRRKKVTGVLNIIKYKFIQGIRIEVKGRLTRRNKAAKSLFKLIQKGNLKDNEFYFDKEKSDYTLKSGLLLRNDVRANTQYISKSSKRRIGSFGVKTWISGK